MRETEEHERAAAPQTIEVEGLTCLIRQLKIIELVRVLGDPDSFVRIRNRNSAGQAVAQQDARDCTQPERHRAEMDWRAVTAG